MSNSIPSHLVKKLTALPLTPGVYLMKGKRRETIYIGKARVLKKRVLSYFQNRTHAPKISVLVSKIRDIDTIETSSEMDALILEAQLIKRYQPRYNQELRDDKSYPFLKITGDEFPRFLLTRKRTDPDAVYYGPYTDAKLLREAVRIIHSLFPIRKCSRLPKTACLYYHIGQCLAPCIHPEVGPAYLRAVREIKRFLGGGKKSLIVYLTERMHRARKHYRFEDAQFFKEQIEALSRIHKRRFSRGRPGGGIGLAGTLELRRRLGLARLPEHIVCFDVSNFQGDQAVASKVSFFRELENKIAYRRYRIKRVRGIDDYAMIREALGRMLAGIREGRELLIPDLILIDGGKGHLNAAVEVLRRENFPDLPVSAIAKQFEFLFVPGRKDPIVFPSPSPALRLLQRIRDEAHRFAITYHRKLKRADMTFSIMDKIPGVGPQKKRLLLSHFKSLEALSHAALSDLTKLPGIHDSLARKIRDAVSLRRIVSGHSI